MKSLICPVSPLQVNESAVRIVGFMVAIIMSLFVATGKIYFAWLLVADFYIRAFTSIKHSPLSWAAERLIRTFNIQGRKIQKAPKIFAARVGFLFSLFVCITFYLGLHSTSIIIGMLLVGFALLESVFKICVGCQVYTYVILPLNKDN